MCHYLHVDLRVRLCALCRASDPYFYADTKTRINKYLKKSQQHSEKKKKEKAGVGKKERNEEESQNRRGRRRNFKSTKIHLQNKTKTLLNEKALLFEDQYFGLLFSTLKRGLKKSDSLLPSCNTH